MYSNSLVPSDQLEVLCHLPRNFAQVCIHMLTSLEMNLKLSLKSIKILDLSEKITSKLFSIWRISFRRKLMLKQQLKTNKMPTKNLLISFKILSLRPSDLRRINTWEREFSIKEKHKWLCMKKPIKRITTVKMKLKITSLSKPRPFATHPKMISTNISLNLVSITMIKPAKKSLTKFQRQWHRVSLMFTQKSEQNYNRILMKPTSKNRIIQLPQKRLTSWLELIHQKTKISMLRTDFSSTPVKMLKISSLLSSFTNSCDRSLWNLKTILQKFKNTFI